GGRERIASGFAQVSGRRIERSAAGEPYGVLPVQRAGCAHSYPLLPPQSAVRDGGARTRWHSADAPTNRQEGFTRISWGHPRHDGFRAGAQLFYHSPNGPPVSRPSD